MKKKVSQILDRIRDYILSTELEIAYKLEPQAFSRKRKLGFQTVFSQILYLLKESLQTAMYRLSNILAIPVVSKQGFCSARKKISPKAFVAVNQKLCSEFYNDNTIKNYYGFVVLAIDGSTIKLPDSKEIREKYKLAKNHSGETSISLGRISYSYDVLNKITVDGILDTCEKCERSMAIEHALNTQALFQDKPVLHLYDRGYTSLTIMFYHNYHQKDFVMRSTLSFFPTEIQNRINGGETDFTIEFKAQKIKGIRKRAEFFKLLPKCAIRSKMNVRILVISLSTGEKEILITTLTDSQFKHEWFKELYNLRWGAEENFKFHKVTMSMENFSGKSELVIQQDFGSSILVSNVKAILVQEAQEELEDKNDWSQRMYSYKINGNIALGVLREELICVLINPDKDLDEFCIMKKSILKKNLVPIRPGRTFPRERKTLGRKHFMTQRLCI